MRRTTQIASIITLALVSVSTVTQSTSAESINAGENNPASMRIGLTGSLFRDLPDALLQVVMRPFRAVMEEQTGLSGTLVSVKDASLLAQQLQNNQVQLGVFHSHEFAWLKAKNPNLTPLMFAVNSKQPLESMIVIRQDCSISGVPELSGKSVLLPKSVRETTHLFANRRCTLLGKPLRKYCEVKVVNDSDDALDQVVDRQADAAVVEKHQWEAFKEDKPGRSNQLKIVLSSEVFPPAVIAYIPGNLQKDAVERFRQGMLQAKNNRRAADLLQLVRITSFEPVPETYEATLANLLKDYPVITEEGK